MKSENESIKEKIVRVASELFYRQGYNATGVQQIIDSAGCSKGAFYSHFRTKEELGLLYLKTRSDEEMSHLRALLTSIEDPRERFLQFTPLMKEWAKSTGYRGCAFSNMAAEVPDGASPIRHATKRHYEEFRTIIHQMVREFRDSDVKYQNLDLQFVSDHFMMIQIGALTNSEIFQDAWPFEHAEKAVRTLIE